MDKQESAFPRFNYELCPRCKDCLERKDFETGMTLRDYFAAKAMLGLLSNSNTRAKDKNAWADCYSEDAYTLADAMLKEREK